MAAFLKIRPVGAEFIDKYQRNYKGRGFVSQNNEGIRTTHSDVRVSVLMLE